MGDVVKTEETQYTIRENSPTGNNQQQPGEKQDSNKSTDSQESESTIEQGLKLH